VEVVHLTSSSVEENNSVDLFVGSMKLRRGPGTCSTSDKCDMHGFKAIGFQSPFGKPMLNSKEAGL
jgi:hypothetical protein